VNTVPDLHFLHLKCQFLRTITHFQYFFMKPGWYSQNIVRSILDNCGYLYNDHVCLCTHTHTWSQYRWPQFSMNDRKIFWEYHPSFMKMDILEMCDYIYITCTLISCSKYTNFHGFQRFEETGQVNKAVGCCLTCNYKMYSY
jgi:hypothetical protein